MTKPFVPSSWHLTQQIDHAMAKFEGDREQQRLCKEARKLDRDVKAMVNEVKAKHYARIVRGY